MANHYEICVVWQMGEKAGADEMKAAQHTGEGIKAWLSKTPMPFEIKDDACERIANLMNKERGYTGACFNKTQYYANQIRKWGAPKAKLIRKLKTMMEATQAEKYIGDRRVSPALKLWFAVIERAIEDMWSGWIDYRLENFAKQDAEKAYAAGKSSDVNPHKHRTKEWVWWSKAYNACEIWEDAKQACGNGKLLSENPHRLRSEEWKQWKEAYIAVKHSKDRNQTFALKLDDDCVGAIEYIDGPSFDDHCIMIGINPEWAYQLIDEWWQYIRDPDNWQYVINEQTQGQGGG